MATKKKSAGKKDPAKKPATKKKSAGKKDPAKKPATKKKAPPDVKFNIGDVEDTSGATIISHDGETIPCAADESETE